MNLINPVNERESQDHEGHESRVTGESEDPISQWTMTTDVATANEFFA